MTPAALLALLPLAANGVSEIAALIARLQSEGRATTTDEETANLKAVLDRVAVDDAAFDKEFGSDAT